AKGRGACNQASIRESQILPFVVQLLTKELNGLRTLAQLPPADLRFPDRGDRQQYDRDRAKLLKKIANAETMVLDADDAEGRRNYEQHAKALRQQLVDLDAKLVPDADPHRYTEEEMAALDEWYADLFANAQPIPISYMAGCALANQNFGLTPN